MLCGLEVQEIARNQAGSPLDRRSFLKCALASGAALGINGVAQPAAGIGAGAASGTQDDARFTVEAKFYQKLAERKIKCLSLIHI